MHPIRYDLVIVGGGIVGTATAREFLKRYSSLKLAILEKESSLVILTAAHQSGHNSGVIHSGIYYTPGSLKARLCVTGLESAYKYCDEKNIPYRKCGKLIVAVKNEEISILERLYSRGKENGVKDLLLLNSQNIKDIEPNCQGLKAIWSPHTGIVDWGQVNKSFGEDCKGRGAIVHLNFCVKNFNCNGSKDFPVQIYGNEQILQSKFVVTCAGLYSDKVSELSGCSSEPKVVPFRGDYLVLKPEKSDLVKTNIYPVPDPSLPFLGVHFTPRMNGQVLLGPNAILAFKKEGYKPFDISLRDTCDLLKYKGFRKLARKYFSYGVNQMYERIFINAQVLQLQQYVPKLQKTDVERGPSGVRAQALNNDGSLVDDFVFDMGLNNRILHLRNAPSPAATSSIEIAKVIADKAKKEFNSSLFL